MKPGLTLVLFILFIQFSFGQTINEIYLPQYVYGAGANSTSRTPYVCRLQLVGLTPNATYRYFARFTPTNSTTAGDGAFIYVKQTGDFVRITSPTAATNYGELTADASGTYTGWFMADPSSSTTFTANGKVKFRIFLNNGNGGISVLSRPTTSSEITVLNYGATTTNCTAIRSTPVTGGVAKNFVMIWDNAAGTGRPVAGSVIESDGVDASNSYAAFYATDVNGVDKAWGTIIPNDMANGIRRISQFSLATGIEVGYKLSSDGSWPVLGGGRTSTVNTTGGLTNVIVLDGALARLDGANGKTDQTITFDPMAAKTYGDADFSPGATTSSGLQISYSSDNTAFASIVNNNVHISGAGSANITAQQSGDDFFNAATAVQQPLTINKAALTITGKDEQVLYGTAIPVLTALYTGFVKGDTEATLTTLPAVTTPATSTSPIGTYDIIASGAVSPNYNITYVKGILTITPSQQSQTITFNTINPVTYGAADFDAGAAASSGLTVAYASSNTQVATIKNGKIHITGAGTATITASQGGSSAWSAAADVTQTLTVNKATLTITADNKTRLANQPNPTLTVSYSGFVNNENTAVLTTQPVVNTTATSSSPAGKYDITVSGAAADNYNIIYVKGTLTIDPLAGQTITFTTLPARQYGDAGIKLNATASSKLSVTFTSSNPSVGIVRNDSVIILAAGTTIITASQAGDATYAPASASQTFTVQKARLYIQANDVAKNEGQPNPPLTITYKGFVKGEDSTILTAPPVVSTNATTTSVAGAYAIIVTGSVAANYTIAQLNGTLSVLPAQGAAQDNMAAYISSPGQLRVNVHAANSGKGVIQLFDNNGTRLVNVNVTLVTGHNTFTVPVATVVAGIYHIRVAVAGVLLKEKIIVQ
ncbi:MBG domain-containing protein [Niastella sp. OAS944]|uniref:MBG domain-containing protein n=1 Tax=Niastella sp. OAS944 TaxID=2664089 RepID=UPI00347FF068|nr:hypothetical protein [Chitinophagaceae bacterium OAS944]